MRETDLYKPVKELLLKQGFDVKAEIKGIDILASKADVLCAVELKMSVSLKLIYQAIDRQKIVDQVYVAIPKSSIKQRSSTYKDFIYLLKRLEIGLIIVSDETAEVLIEAIVYDREKSRARYKRRKQQTVKEFRLRKYNKNVGGTNQKHITRYKEQVIKVASYLKEHGPASPKAIKENTKVLKTASILQKNYDLYFKRVSRGVYQVSDDKIETILNYKKLLEGGIENENS